ncbi:hypothetical protein P5G65_09070 [Paenibacillus chondroitinus]|uniref:Uncharacterized protein n=1 Tax=Paenibacillus chondroitinus TaxID=59842 RepID=A0ABU6DAU6_9BACL|nr:MULTISPECIES: hypothetical protein [Paenibacillus]MCY9659775.1 hypothetical protein [Paenibacillus anseongense]MEB4794046.1 hypothetical protein [Paenibacillus chondroitinus]
MAHKVISDEELLLLLSPICDNQETNVSEKPKLSMKLLYELIKKLNQENVILSNRIAEYERRLDILMESKAQIASSAEMTVLIEPVRTTEVKQELSLVLSPTDLTPRSMRHPSPKKKSISLLFLKALTKLFVRRRRFHPLRH